MAWRYLAQDALTQRWLEMDLPLTVDADSPRWELGGAGSLTGVIDGDHPWLRNNDAGRVLAEWGTFLYAELDGEIVWGGIVQSSDYDGPDWRVQAFGFVSYANDTPYTGDYQKLVNVDPGVVWAKLWQHVQGQPDGNLRLQTIAPADLGPNIGTKDEPYELAWWEAKDCGAELQQLADEVPFDYVEEHRWTVPATVAGLASVRVGYGNLQGGYDGKDKGWMKGRADAQTDLIASLDRDVFVAVELHEETSSAMPKGAHRWFEGRMKALQDPAWALYEGDGGNHALYRSDRLAPVSYVKRQGIDDPTRGGSANLRSASLWTFRDLATGQLVPVAGYHFHANDTKSAGGESRHDTRLAEAADTVNLVGANTKAIVVGDFNNWKMDPGQVYSIITAKTGAVPIVRQVDVGNGDLDTYGTKRRGRHIDMMLTNPQVWSVSDARIVPTRKLSDHGGWWVATFVPVQAGAGTVLDPSRKVTHTVTLSYPRAGRRRLDLRFVQGENILETVRPKRSGDRFANGVITLGKGEGSKTVRGELVVRDGRLRRVAIYTDKLASTTARCFALAARERGYRSLGEQIDSVVVAEHPHAPIGSWALGDDVLIEADLPHLGRYADWHRIVGWSRATDTTARLYLERADSFTYGPVTPVPTDSVPGDDVEDGDR